jgi:hypothetical protein
MTREASAQKAPPAQPRLASDAETAEYIGDLLGQLERLARSHGLVRLQYLLKGCQEEAARVAAGG